MFEKYINNRFYTLFISPFFLGSLTTLSFAPFNFTFVNLFIFPIFFYLVIYINKKSKSIYRKKPYKKNLFIFGLLFGFGFYLSGLSWITHSLTFDENFKVLIPFAFIFIPIFLSLFIAIPILIIGPILKLNFPSILLFSAILSLSDYIRSKILSGFPWNLWAYSTSELNEMLQIINLIGLHSYNLIVITLFTLPIIFFYKIRTLEKILSSIFIIFFLLGFYIYGSYEINNNKEKIDSVNDSVYVKIVSPNFDLKYGLSLKEIEERFAKLIRYSDPKKEKKTLFIWPEGVFSGYSYIEILVFKDLILKKFSNNHLILLGVNTLDPKTEKFYNSMILVNNELKILNSYNKQKLVPFGEFLPFENLLHLFGLKKITEGQGSFLKGYKNKNLLFNKLNILPLICYEVIFTELIQKSDNDTNLMINISEDGWFGETIGPDQHFAKSIFRAIENNTFFLRSANRGISAIIDNKGSIIKQLSRNEAGNIEFNVPLIKSNKNKNDLIFFTLLITYLIIFFIYKKKNAK
tara:strand:+ start:5529 stop:7088 length:1560 start_codon:yes stop_codon:yes gene_type:complete